MNESFDIAVQKFADLLHTHQLAGLKLTRVDCEANRLNVKTSVKPGKKYTKVDIGGGGRYMVENSTRAIFGIKAYGVIHRGHQFGTLDTINGFWWGQYRAQAVAGLTGEDIADLRDLGINL